MELRRVTKKKSKIRLGLSGPSGSGKTMSAIKIAKGLVGDLSKVAVIDSESGSVDLYESLGDFQVLGLTAPYSPERYIEAIRACESAGMEVIIVDSISHEWEGSGGCLEIHEKLGGKFQTWAEVTPRHRAFINAILTSSCHVITTARSKTEYSLSNDNGKNRVEKLGMKDITREGFDYELTIDLDLDLNHNARASKDRTGLFMDKPPFVASEETGKIIRNWCETGAAAPKLSDVLDKINSANSEIELKAVTSDASQLTGKDKIEAQKAYKEKLNSFKKQEVAV
jgi:hypothetical protein